MAKLQEHAKIATAASTQLLAAANGAERCNGELNSYPHYISNLNMIKFKYTDNLVTALSFKSAILHNIQRKF